MRTTRRRLLGLLGLGAASAALGAPAQTAEAAEPCHQCQPDSLYPHVYGHGDWITTSEPGVLQPNPTPDETRAFDSMVAHLVERCADHGCTLSVGSAPYLQVWSFSHSHPNARGISWLLYTAYMDIDYVDIVRDPSAQAKRLAYWVNGCHADATVSGDYALEVRNTDPAGPRVHATKRAQLPDTETFRWTLKNGLCDTGARSELSGIVSHETGSGPVRRDDASA